LERASACAILTWLEIDRGITVARPRLLLLVVLMSASLAGCASPTPYQPAAGGFGYSDQQIEDNRYRVTFAGNSVTSRDTVQNYLLYRAAQITVQNHHDYFTVVNQNTERSTYYQGTGYNNWGWPGGWRGTWPWGPTDYSAYPIDRYTGFADIIMGDGEKPKGNPNSYDARDVMRQLGPTLVLPKEDAS
jgi:hypothetical protein